MGKQYKSLTQKDIEFIKQQRLFYLASSSGNEVNLAPKGYDSIRIIDANTLVFLSYSGSGNRTYTDTKANGEFTVLFNAYEGNAKILRAFCKAQAIDSSHEKFQDYLKLFDEKEALIRHFFEFNIYAVESSCGEAIPIMEFKEERKSLKNWMKKMDKNGKLEKYNEDHLNPPNLHDL